MIDKTYQPSAVEGRIYAKWEEAGAFRAGRPQRRDARPYCIVIPPPNVTGSLHMGHALNNTLQDVLVRFERMRGRDVLWQPGTDHAGIATQMVVERQLMERQEPPRRVLGREKFLEKVWAWKAEAGGTITAQLKRLGASCDWSRERFTMDEGLSRAVRKVFVELYRGGLIYKDKRLVNWDPKLLTAISDLEVQQVEVKGHLWHIRYPLEGARFDPNDAATFITVATTRPETMLGDVAVAVHPEDERYRQLVGKHAILPLVGRRIAIIADEYSDPEKGTGAVKITPAHDFNDFEVGRRHQLPLVNILDAEAHLNLAGNEAFLRDVPRSAELDATLTYHGLDRFVARKEIVRRLEASDQLAKTEAHAHTVPHGDRSAVVIEPFLTDQWYVDAKTLAQPAIAAVRAGRTVFVPRNWEATYFNWMENIQPWCISRQLWWGHQIPAWYGPDGKVFVAESEAEALSEAMTHYGGNATISAAAAAEMGQRGKLLTRDEDVLDTWFSSALWPFSTLGWPDETTELKRYYPTGIGALIQAPSLPSPANYVDIDPDKKDIFGIPQLRFHFQWGQNELLMWEHSKRVMTDLFKAMGGAMWGMDDEPNRPGTSLHETGVCRFGNDSKTSVTNKWAQTHDVPNLYICDASIFPSPTDKTTTMPIIAFTMRTCDRMLNNFKQGIHKRA